MPVRYDQYPEDQEADRFGRAHFTLSSRVRQIRGGSPS
jgi:hypothetical protein